MLPKYFLQVKHANSPNSFFSCITQSTPINLGSFNVLLDAGLNAEQKASDGFAELVPFATVGILRLKLKQLAPTPVVQARPVKMLFELRLMPKKESPILA